MKLIILDRDGVINYDSEHYIKSPAEWIPIPGSLAAIAALNAAGYTVAVASNQSGVARGLYSVPTLDAIHAKCQQELAGYNGFIDQFFYCPHKDEDLCACRKPKTGLLKQIEAHYNISLTKVPFVGDSWRDIVAALDFGCQPILVCTGNGRATLNQYSDKLTNIPIHEDLNSFVVYLLNSCRDAIYGV